MSTDKKKKRKELVIYAVATLVGLLGVYFILRPYIKPSKEVAATGMDTSLPDAGVTPLVTDKIEVYRTNRDEVVIESQEEQVAQAIIDKDDELDQVTTISDDDGSISRPNSVQEELQAYYMSEDQWRQEYEYNQHLYRLQEEKEELERQLAEKQQLDDLYSGQMAMLERSFQLQQKYSPEAQQAARQHELEMRQLELQSQAQQRQFESSDRNLATTSVVSDQRSVVSTLQPTISDSVLMAHVEAGNENLLGFNTVTDNVEGGVLRNAFRVRVDETQVLRIGDNLVLRTMEPVRLSNGIIIPRNTPLIATTSLRGNRMVISIDALEHKGSIYGVKWVGYDLNGQLGVYVPWSDEGGALKEFGAGVAQTAGTSINFNQSSAKDQVLSDLARGLMRGGANYLANRVKDVKVTFNAGYQLYLMDTSNVQRL